MPGLALFRRYTPSLIRVDVLAALSLWAVVVPQSLAYGELAGIPPINGLYTALAGMGLYWIFASSRYLNVGPESSVAIVVAASIQPFADGDPDRALALAAMLAIITGGLLLVGAALRFGVVTRLLSTPILAGYLTGSAIIIIASQIPKVFGISTTGDDWYEKTWEVVSNLPDANEWALILGIGTIALVLLLQRFLPMVPAFLLAMVVATVVVSIGDLADAQGVAVVGSVDRGLPVPSWPGTGLGDALDLLPAAVPLALLVFASSMATGSALAARDNEDLAPTNEFLGLAVANVGSGLLGGFTANHSDSRSFIVAGGEAKTQRVNAVCAVFVVITLIALTPLFENLPTAALGGVVLVSAVKLIDVAGLRRLFEVRQTDFALGIITFAGVLIVGVLEGIAVGAAVSLLEVMRRAVFPNTAVLGRVQGTYRDVDAFDEASAEPGLLVYRFDAPLFFANAAVFREDIRQLVRNAEEPVKLVVVNAEGMTDMDVTGAEAVSRLLDDLHRDDVRLAMARVRTSVRATMRRLGVEEKIGVDGFYLRVTDATASLSRRRSTLEDSDS